jgi:hypothetical protein
MEVLIFRVILAVAVTAAVIGAKSADRRAELEQFN